MRVTGNRKKVPVLQVGAGVGEGKSTKTISV